MEITVKRLSRSKTAPDLFGTCTPSPSPSTGLVRIRSQSCQGLPVLNNKFLPLALLALGQTVFAQQLPSAGSQIQQIPPTPIPQKTAPVIRIEPSSAPATEASDAVKITVNRLQVTGSRVYPESELLSLTGFTPGSELSLGELRAMALKIKLPSVIATQAIL